MSLKAITFGSAMVDIIAVLQSNSIEQMSLSNAHSQYLLVEPGRKIEAQSISSHIGGGALNTGVCLSRLGCETAPVVKTGDDPSRHSVLEHCAANNLETATVLTEANGATGSAVMIASHDKNAAIFTQRGANTMLIEDDLADVDFTNADMVHAAPLSGQSAALLPLISTRAHVANVFFSCNPGIRQITNRANSVLLAAKNMSLISLNAVEAAALVPCLSAIETNLQWKEPVTSETTIGTQGAPVSLLQFCEVFHSHGPENILITFGGEGAWLYDGKELHHQPIISAKVAGTAGAGDSFVSTLAWGLKTQRSPQDALVLAAHNASSVVSFVNTTDGLLEKEKLFDRAGL